MVDWYLSTRSRVGMLHRWNATYRFAATPAMPQRQNLIIVWSHRALHPEGDHAGRCAPPMSLSCLSIRAKSSHARDEPCRMRHQHHNARSTHGRQCENAEPRAELGGVLRNRCHCMHSLNIIMQSGSPRRAWVVSLTREAISRRLSRLTRRRAFSRRGLIGTNAGVHTIR